MFADATKFGLWARGCGQNAPLGDRQASPSALPARSDGGVLEQIFHFIGIIPQVIHLSIGIVPGDN